MGSQSTSSTTLTTSSILSSSAGPGDLKTSSSAVQQFRSSLPSSAVAVLPMWSPAVTVSGMSSSLVQTTMSSSLSTSHQPSLPSSPMSSTALLPLPSVAAVWSTSLRSTPTVTLPPTNTGVCQSGATPPPPPVAVSTLCCSRTSTSVASDSLCSHDVQQSAVKLDGRDLLITDLLFDSLADNSIASTGTTDIGSDLRSPGSVIQPDSEPDSFSFDNSDVSNYHITDLFSNSFTNQSSTPVDHNSLAISRHHSPTEHRFCSYFPRFWTCNVRGGVTSKIDEIAEIMFTNGIDVAVLVETWLHWGIHDDCPYTGIFCL